MILADVEALAAAGESETLELKASTGERVAGAMAVCAMLNHRGGSVLFGVQPNRHVSGQKVGDRTIEQLSSALSEIDPPAFPSIEQVRVRGDLSVIVVTVSVGQHQPYSHRGRALRRVGNTNRAMSRDEYHRVLLERLHGQHRWENEPATDWAVDNLDPSEITRTIDDVANPATGTRRFAHSANTRVGDYHRPWPWSEVEAPISSVLPDMFGLFRLIPVLFSRVVLLSTCIAVNYLFLSYFVPFCPLPRQAN